ncbi:MAG: CHC2 zinc finger domain-containing protein [Prevotella sp.]
MKSEELEKIRSTPIEEVAEELGMKVVRHTALCPFPNDTHPSLHFNRGKNRYKCFACGATGDVVDLVMKYNNVGFREAVEWLSEERGVRSEEKILGSEESGVRSEICLSLGLQQCGNLSPHSPLHSPHSSKSSLPDIEYLSTLVAHPVINAEAAHFLYDERKIDPSVVKWCGLTSISVPMPCWRWGKAFYDAPSLLIPYLDVDGKLLTVQGRKLRQAPLPPGGGCCNEADAQQIPPPGGGWAPRFRFPPGSQVGMYNKPVLRRLGEGDELWITEGPSDCWAMLSSSRKAVAIPSATSLTVDDVCLLREGLPKGVSLHMMPDNDRPGMELFQTLKRSLPQLQGHVLPEGVKDFGQWYAAAGLDVVNFFKP